MWDKQQKKTTSHKFIPNILEFEIYVCCLVCHNSLWFDKLNIALFESRPMYFAFAFLCWYFFIKSQKLTQLTVPCDIPTLWAILYAYCVVHADIVNFFAKIYVYLFMNKLTFFIQHGPIICCSEFGFQQENQPDQRESDFKLLHLCSNHTPHFPRNKHGNISKNDIS